MSGMWKRSYGEVTRAPSNERDGNRQTKPTATAPHLDSTQLKGRYLATMIRVLSDGAEMCAVLERGTVVGVAVFRVYENTVHGKHLYVDDLITDETLRSRGVGRVMLDHLTHIAQIRSCRALTLDSGTQRTRAHAFYFREGFTITAFHFVKPL